MKTGKHSIWSSKRKSSFLEPRSGPFLKKLDNQKLEEKLRAFLVDAELEKSSHWVFNFKTSTSSSNNSVLNRWVHDILKELRSAAGVYLEIRFVSKNIKKGSSRYVCSHGINTVTEKSTCLYCRRPGCSEKLMLKHWVSLILALENGITLIGCFTNLKKPSNCIVFQRCSHRFQGFFTAEIVFEKTQCNKNFPTFEKNSDNLTKITPICLALAIHLYGNISSGRRDFN